MSSLVEKADLVAWTAHTAVGQKRRYSGLPYIVHPRSVCKRLKDFGVQNENILASALLHDVVEDTKVKLDDLAQEFPTEVIVMVGSLTKKPGLPKEEATTRMLETLQKCEIEAVLIKMADRIDNLHDWPKDSLPERYVKEAEMILDLARERLGDAGYLGDQFFGAYHFALEDLDKTIQMVRC